MKQKFIIVILGLLTGVGSGRTQTLDLDQKVPVDTTIRKGVLSNGMTYYIKSTDVVKDAASYYIIQNVGSILENDDQRGLAHFLEHMAFNGTENFPGKGIIHTLQEHGAVFGKDINAYTSFDETVYNLNHIPTGQGMVDTCLTMLRDWSNFLLLTDEEIDAERGVVKEEWRTRQNGRSRLLETSLPVTYNHSKYAERLPIGDMSVIGNFSYETLRDFYHDWYRTDLQAIAVIGDVDVDRVECLVRVKFSDIPAVAHPKPRKVVAIPGNDTLLYSLAMDPEVPTASLHFGIRHPRAASHGTVGDLKRSLLESMVTRMLSDRIVEKSQSPEAPFLAGRIGYGSMSRTTEVLRVDIYPKPGQQAAAFASVMAELVRAVRFGFTDTEIQRVKARMSNAYENGIAQQSDKSHAQIEQAIQDDFLNGSPPADLEGEYAWATQVWGTLTPDDFLHTIGRLYAKNNRYLNVTGVQGNANLTRERAQTIIEDLEGSKDLEPYSERLAGRTLLDGQDIVAGQIVKEVDAAVTGSKTFVLDNGIQVHYKFVDKEKDKVVFRALSYGGTSLLEDGDLPSARLLSNLIPLSGVGAHSATDLKKLLAGKSVDVKIGVGNIHEEISGNATSKDVKSLLQLVHLYFVAPRFDRQAYDRLMENVGHYVSRRSQDVNEKMKDSLMVSLYGPNNPKEPLFDQRFVASVSFERMQRIYQDRFANAADFTFYISGDIKEEELKPLLRTYLASIPTTQATETYTDNGAEWMSDTIAREIPLAMENPKANIRVFYKKEMPYELRSSLYMKALGDILQLRLTETVRESKGGAYSPRAGGSFSREPKSQAMLSIGFDCNPELADTLMGVVVDEVKAISEGNIADGDLEKVRTNLLKEREQLKEKNAYDMQWLMTYHRYGEDINAPKNFEEIVQQMATKDIQELARQLLGSGKSYKIVFVPLIE